MAASTNITISAHDKNVLNQLFNPGLPYGDVVDADISEENENDAVVEETESIKKAKALEVRGVRAAEAGNVEEALSCFSQAVVESPTWPSAYNNRAQALRLQGDEEGAMRDLDTAIELSNGKGSVACQAYTQRGLLKKKAGDEEGAKRDLQQASELGSGFAKQLVASMNPYAALCNQMLSNVIQKLRNGEADD